MNPKKTKIYLALILLLAFFLRVAFLDRVPVGINDDELHFVLNSKSIFYGNKPSFSEISSLIFAPVIGPLPTNLLTAKLPYAIVGVLSVFLIYLITLKLTKNINLSLAVSLIASINPWSIYTSRTAFDAPIAIFFFLLCPYLMTLSKPKYILLSIIPGFLAFNSYIGTRIIYFPFVLISSFYLWKFFNKKFRKYYILVSIFSFLITLNFVVSLPSQSIGSRISELWTPNSQKIISQVNDERRQSLQPPITLLTNKYTIYFRNFFEKYLNNFSPSVLFLNGDQTFTGSLWVHGYFYYIDILLIFFGIIILYRNYRPFLFFDLSLILLSPIPEAIRSDSIPAYVFHSSFQYPFILILIGAGIYFIFKSIHQKIFKILFVLIYLLSLLNFLNIYFFRSPVYQPESFAFSRRVVSKYLSLESKNNREVYFLTRQPELMYRSYIFYSNSFSNNLSKTNPYIINRIHFIDNQNSLPADKNYTLIFDTDNYTFEDSGSKLYISRLSDAGKIYSIYRGTSCQNMRLGTYTHDLNISDLKVEKLDTNRFCLKFITS